ncbi:uncharacterized protein PHACADRAFT_210465 [Phanerochaete carnosa HHB-10118-sp]|uniref:FAD-binding domain-containing protein n=1 Tax=Phanerochaete carnosa (strain HHB-10118-sp) TaxID=650164 RepID=K5W6U4_PHACS|nr:uncharacterized protein PHACADRAFT_210465 [Phanerochaete carnosa HHB-10118-sp]EKM54679.1 hypothetical protein PHACADRAFT_210465 [Phanerochaete carnosa HHB-10118-sp]
MTQPLRVAVCGGGIGGLFLTLVLKKYAGSKSLLVDVYEAESSYAEIGAGITVWGRTRSVMETLELGEALAKWPDVPSITFRKSDTQESFEFHNHFIPNGKALPRTEMLKLLVNNLPPEDPSFLTKHFNKRLTSYEQDADGVTLHFADGSVAQADILVGADGVGSATRKKMYSDLAGRVRSTDAKRAEELTNFIPPSWTGTGVTSWTGKDKHVITYPISATLINVLFFETIPGGLGTPLTGPTVSTASREEVINLYKDWEPELRIITEVVGETSKWAISQIQGLPSYVDGRVALLGDSAHAMTTHFGAGAGQAIEDAYILGRLLAQPATNLSNVKDALRIYDAIRRPIASEIVERSLKMGFLYELSTDGLPPGTDAAKVHAGDRDELQKVIKVMTDLWTWHSASMPEEDWLRAQEKLRTA